MLPPQQLYCIDEASILSASFDQLLDEDPSPLTEPQPGVDEGWLIIPTAAVDGVPKGAFAQSAKCYLPLLQFIFIHFGREAIEGHLIALADFSCNGSDFCVGNITSAAAKNVLLKPI